MRRAGGWASPDVAPRVLIVGYSTRAAAESAARTGLAVTALDAFDDLDRHAAVRGLSMPRDLGAPFGARAAARAARGIGCEAVVYLSPFENHPAAVRELARGRALWGNAPEVLARVRDPQALTAALRRHGLPAPAVRTAADDPPDAGAWLLKPRASGGGRGVRAWRRGEPVPRGRYLQERVEGTPGSVTFVADGRRVVVLGVSRQLAGEAAFGAHGFQYCGSVLAPAPLVGGESHAAALAQAVTESFGLVGLNGVDFVVRDGIPHAVEVNPRHSASMELVERARGTSILGAHVAACVDGALPDGAPPAARDARVHGKAVLYARRAVTVGDTRPWLDDASVRDVPRPGERIARGAPVCTVFAEGSDADACHAALVARADAAYAALAAWERAAA